MTSSQPPAETQASADAKAAAREGGLRYVNDDDAGIRRVRAGKGFTYRRPDGSRLTDRLELARGRKQYRYHPLWRTLRDEAKFERTLAFGQALPGLRRRVERDLSRRRDDRLRVLATVVRLLDTTLLRVGNEEYARDNRSFGLTTLRDRHARIRGQSLRLSFVGKSGKRHEVGLRDRRLASIVRRCQELPGQRLFQYVDEDGGRQGIDSDDVNAYIREASGGDFSARDFRTWAGTMLCFRSLRGLRAAGDAGGGSDAARRREVNQAVKEVARWLGNTPAVCRSAYIHPAVIEDYLTGDGRAEGGGARRSVTATTEGSPTLELRPPPRRELGADERAVLERLRSIRRERARRRRPPRNAAAA